MTERGCWEGSEEEGRSSRGGRASFIDVESGGGPVHAPCLMRRAPFPGGQAAVLR